MTFVVTVIGTPTLHLLGQAPSPCGEGILVFSCSSAKSTIGPKKLKTSNDKSEAMLTSDQTLVSSRGSQTLPGTAGSTVFAQITGTVGNAVERRVAATSNTTPETIKVAHELKGIGYKQRCRSLIKHSRVYNNTDPSTTGGVVPSFSWSIVLDRPLQSGGAVTTAHIKDALGQLMDLLLISGQLDKILNQEA